MMASPYNVFTKLVFVPSSAYLSEPIYNSLKEGSDTKKELMVYFNIPEINKQNKNSINSNFWISLEDLEVLNSYFSFPIFKKVIYFFRFVLDLRKYKKRIFSRLNQENPDAILTTAETISTLICLDWARSKKKLGVVIQPSFISIDEFQKRKLKYDIQNLIFVFLSGCRINSNNNLFGTSFTENFVFYFSKSLEPFYKKSKHSRRMLMPNVQFQNYFRLFESAAKERSEFRNILMCVQNYEKYPNLVNSTDANDINKMYIEIIKYFPGIHFIIKIHPRQTEDELFYRKQLQAYRLNNFEFVIDEPLVSLFSRSSLHISSGSYTILEALLSGIPSINLKPNVISLGIYLNGKAELTANTTDEVISLMKQSMKPFYYNEFLVRRQEFIHESFHDLEKNTHRYLLDSINKLTLENTHGD